MKVSIVIPNYNVEEILKKNLPKGIEALRYYIEKQHEQGEIVIADDASTDNSVESIKYYVSSIKDENISFKFLHNIKNLGFSSTVNRGVEEASGEIVVLLNTDVAPEKDFLEYLVPHFKDPEVFAVGCMDKSIEKDKTVLRGRGIGKWKQGFLQHARGEVDKNNTLWASGGSSAFKKSLWVKLGGFNPLYNPFYWEDIDLSYRALRSGYKIIFESKSMVTHAHAQGSIRKKYTSTQIKTIAYRNQILFVWINITDIDLWVNHLVYLPFHLIRACMRGDISFLFGYTKALCLLPQAIISRVENKKRFKKSDKEILQSYNS